MFWFISIMLLVIAGAALLLWLHTRRLVMGFTDHLLQTRSELESRFHQRRNLIPSFIALGAGIPGLETECLETLDNAVELVIRSHGFEERMIAENRLSSALGYFRNRLSGLTIPMPPDLAALIRELDDREAGIAVASELYNRQIKAYRDNFTRPLRHWLGSLCWYRPPHPVVIRLSTTPVADKTRRLQTKEESTP